MAVRVGALLLSAGYSERFGSSKLLATLNSGNTIFGQTRDRLMAAIPEYVVVTRAEISEQIIDIEPSAQVFHEASRGMGASLAFGIQLARQREWEATLVCLADMPFVSSNTYEEVANAARPNAIVVPKHDNRLGNPVCFGSDFYQDLLALDGDKGGRSLLKHHNSRVLEIDIDDAAILDDIDTPAELTDLQSRYQ